MSNYWQRIATTVHKVIGTVVAPFKIQTHAGAGFDSDGQEEIDRFFFHSDHLGSTSYLTDHDGNVSQFVCYTPYGETLVDEHLTGVDSIYRIAGSSQHSSSKLDSAFDSLAILHNGTYRTRYLFNGKELDTETNLYYYGARYFEPVTTLWYGVDPLAEKYPFNSGYVYCNANPVKYVDPDGREVFNGHEDEYQKAKEKYEHKKQRFDNGSYNGNLSLKKQDFQTKEEWKKYKEARRSYLKAERKYNQAKSSYEKAQLYIDTYKKVDPDSFEDINSLRTSDGRAVDIYIFVNKGGTYEYGGAYTSFQKDNGQERLVANIYLQSGDYYSNKLAHEFGHVFSYSLDPSRYFYLSSIDPNHNCRDIRNDHGFLSECAMDYERSWDRILSKKKRLKK